MVRGRKSNGFSSEPVTEVTRTLVSPHDTMTAPLACLAYLPVSNVTILPPISTVLMTCFMDSPGGVSLPRGNPIRHAPGPLRGRHEAIRNERGVPTALSPRGPVKKTGSIRIGMYKEQGRDPFGRAPFRSYRRRPSLLMSAV